MSQGNHKIVTDICSLIVNVMLNQMKWNLVGISFEQYESISRKKMTMKATKLYIYINMCIWNDYSSCNLTPLSLKLLLFWIRVASTSTFRNSLTFPRPFQKIFPDFGVCVQLLTHSQPPKFIYPSSEAELKLKQFTVI